MTEGSEESEGRPCSGGAGVGEAARGPRCPAQPGRVCFCRGRVLCGGGLERDRPPKEDILEAAAVTRVKEDNDSHRALA